MSLGIFSNVDLDAYLDGPRFAANIQVQSALNNARAGLVYIDKLTRFLCTYKNPLSSQADGWALIDPQLIDNVTTSVGSAAMNAIDNRPFWHIGAYDPNANEQRLFRWNDESLLRFEEMSLTNPAVVVDSDPFPNVGTLNSRNPAYTTATTDGYYSTGVSNERGDWVFFPEWGYAFTYMRTVRFGGVSLARVAALVDLNEGFAVPIAGLPVEFTATPANAYQASPLFNRPVSLFYSQFIPDANSTGPAPKGTLYLFSEGNNGVQSARELFVKAIDWNPTAAGGTPNRVHLRERIVTRHIVNRQTGFLAGTNQAPANAGTGFHGKIDPRARLLVHFLGQSSTDATRGAGDNCMMRFTTQAVLDVLTAPTERFPVETGRVVEIRTEARGDLNEIIPGVPLTWQCRRVSTRGELLPTTDQPNDTVQLANATAGVGGLTRAAGYPFAIYQNGVELTETVDYTVDAPNGQVTLIADTTGNVYTADYVHIGNPVLPAFGTLLNSTSVTDESGEAAARIRYDDVPANAGFIDRWDVTD